MKWGKMWAHDELEVRILKYQIISKHNGEASFYF